MIATGLLPFRSCRDLRLEKEDPLVWDEVAKQTNQEHQGAMSYTQEPHHKTRPRASTLFASGEGQEYTERFSSLRRRTKTIAGAAYAAGEKYHKNATRYHFCSQAVTFNEWADNETGEIKYTYGGGKPCRQRLCSCCQHLKSRVLVTQLQQVYEHHIEEMPDSVGLLLTLTIKNCAGEDLRETVKQMHYAFGKLRRRIEFEGAVRGFFRATEVTRNKQDGTYHPHMHVLLMVPRSYFSKKSGLYITHDMWCELWRDCLGVDYRPVVGITAVTAEAMQKRKKRTGAELSVIGAIKEVAKYCVKPDGFQEEKNGRFFTDPQVFTELFEGMRAHRLYAWGGEFDKIRKLLALPDVEGDIDLDEELKDAEKPRQNYTHIAKLLMMWDKYACDGLGLYVPVTRLDLATGETTVLHERWAGGG